MALNSPRIGLEYFTLNVTVLPAHQNTKEYYGQLINRLFYSRIPISYGDYFYKLTRLDNIENGDGYYGVISKYVSLDGLEWVEGESDVPINYNHPDNVKGRRATYEFVFSPQNHKFAFIKKGRIDQEVKRRGAPLKAITEILKSALNIVLQDEGKTAEVFIVQNEQIFEEIFSNSVKSLDLTVSYSNPGLGNDHEQLMDEYLRDAHIGRSRINMQPDSRGEINTDSVFAKGLIDLARENGKVKAKIEMEDGEIKTINTVDHPQVTTAIVDKAGDVEGKFIVKILSQLRTYFNNEE